MSLDRENPSFFDNNAHLLHPARRLALREELGGIGRGAHARAARPERPARAAPCFTIYRYLGDHFKVGVGYNFTDFSDDLTDLSYDHHGLFLNLVGTM